MQNPYVRKSPVPAAIELAVVLWVLGAVSVFAASAAPKTAPRALLDRVAVIVNKDAITEDELDETVAATLAQQGKRADPESKLYKSTRKELLDALVREVLLAQEADSMGVSVNDAEIDQQVSLQMDSIQKRFASQAEFVEALRKEGISEDDLRSDNKRRLTRQMKAQRALAAKRDEVQDKVMAPEAEVKARYQKKPTDFDAAHFAIIFFRIPEDAPKGYPAEAKKQAEDLLNKIKAGGDFAAMAKKYSEDTLSGDKGGDMGEMFRVQMDALDPGLGKAVLALGPKQMGVITTAQGVYIVRMSSKRRALYAEAAPVIRKMMQGGGQSDALEAWIKDIRAKAYIKEIQ